MYTSITNRGVSIKNKMIENYYILNQIVQGIDTGIVIIYQKSLLHINNEMRRIARRTYKEIECDILGIVCPQFKIPLLRAYISVLKEHTDKEDIYLDLIMPGGGVKSVKCRLARIKIFESNGIFLTVHEEFSETRRDIKSPMTIKLWRKYSNECGFLLNKTHDFIVFVDNFFKVQNVNRNVEKYLGYSRSEFIGRPLETVCDIEPQKDFAQIMTGFRKTPTSNSGLVVKDFHVKIAAKNSEKIDFTVSVFAVNVHNYRKGYCMIFTKVPSEEKNSNNTDETAANIAHEFRSPLNAIIGFSNIIAEENINSYEKNLYLKYIRQSCKSLLSIVNDFSDFNKLNHNKILIHNSDFSMNELFEQLEAYCSIYKKDFNKTDIQVVSSAQHQNKDVIINADRERVFQIMINLLNNAFKFTEKGIIKYQYIIDNGFLFLKVSDSGIGIPKENLNKIFQRMTQLDVKNSNKGSGLGLSISKNLVELMGGVISVNSEVGVGTEFIVKLPVRTVCKHKTEGNNNNQQNYDFSNKKFIIAEDAQINYILLAKILEKTRAEIIWAKNGEECVEKFMTNRDADLILMDMQMPIMDGFEATKQILSIDPKTKIIAQTAFSYSEERKRILGIGCLDYISKPIDKKLLYEKIEKVLRE